MDEEPRFHRPPPIQLKTETSDEQLNAWAQNAQAENEAGEQVLDVTPYEANRFILHALTTPMSEWSTQYGAYLLRLLAWISEASEDDDLATKAFKKVYPKALLSNLTLMALVQQSNSLAPEHKAAFITWQESFNSYVLTYQENLLESIYRAMEPSYLPIIEPHLIRLIQDAYQLYTLFSLSEEVLSAAQRTLIWNAIRPRLYDLIQSGSDFALLFSLSERALTAEQRTQIWDAIADRLGGLIQEWFELTLLFDLREEQLNEAQRIRILTDLGDHGLNHLLPGDALKNTFYKGLRTEQEKRLFSTLTGYQPPVSVTASGLFQAVPGPLRVRDAINDYDSDSDSDEALAILRAVTN